MLTITTATAAINQEQCGRLKTVLSIVKPVEGDICKLPVVHELPKIPCAESSNNV